jgi:virulence-associated protein VapD
MFAVPFDLVVAEIEKHHPKGVSQACADIGGILFSFGFEHIQGSLYVSRNEDLATLFSAIQALRAQPWLPKSVRNIRAFRIEQWTDFTAVVKAP